MRKIKERAKERQNKIEEPMNRGNKVRKKTK